MKICYITLGLGWTVLSQATNCDSISMMFYNEVGLVGDMLDLDIKPGVCSEVPEGFDKSVWVS